MTPLAPPSAMILRTPPRASNTIIVSLFLLILLENAYLTFEKVGKDIQDAL
jgi:hypothetical protein